MRIASATLRVLVAVCAIAVMLTGARGRASVSAIAGQTDVHVLLDRVLDTYVRGGLVYYRALKGERATIDKYVASLDVAPGLVAGWSADAQKAFWINAYNAIVLRTVIDAYPIQGKSPEYPADSIRQIPGSFERRQHRVAGQTLTLDEIETRVLAGFGDARIVFALGRGAIGSPRLRSEAVIAAKLGAQLDEAVKECVQRKACFEIDRAASVVRVSPIIGWRADLFTKTFLTKAAPWPKKSPIERAIAAMVAPHLLPGERDILTSDSFTVQYGEIDWHLNDLTSR